MLTVGSRRHSVCARVTCLNALSTPSTVITILLVVRFLNLSYVIIASVVDIHGCIIVVGMILIYCYRVCVLVC